MATVSSNFTLKKEEVTHHTLTFSDVSIGTFTTEELSELCDVMSEHLGRMKVESMNCNERMSHRPHVEIKQNVIKYCRGRSQDAT